MILNDLVRAQAPFLVSLLIRRKLDEHQDKAVTLLEIDSMTDFAIFVISEEFKPAEMPQVDVKLSDLEPYGASGTWPLWQVCYCGENRELDADEQSQALNFMNDWNTTNPYRLPTLYEVLVRRYRAALGTSQNSDAKNWNAAFFSICSSGGVPPFESLFKTNRRALAVGEFVQSQPQEDDSPGEALGTPQPCHDISDFPGLSGSMVCTFHNGEISKPKIIGICGLSPVFLLQILTDGNPRRRPPG